MLKSIFSALLFLILLLAPLVSFVSIGDDTVSWTDTKYFQECGIRCSREHAVEQLSQRAMFIVEQRKRVEGLVNDKAPVAEIQAEIGAFCTDTELSVRASRKEIDACFGRYKDLRADELRRIRSELGSQELRLSALDTKQGGRHVFERPSDAKKIAPSAQFESLQSLEDTYHDRMAQTDPATRRPKRESLISIEYQEWLDSLPRDPAPDEHMKFTEVKLKNGDTLWLPDASTLDPVSLSIAQREYRAKIGKRASELNGRAAKLLADQVTYNPVLKFNDRGIGEKSVDAIQAARDRMVESANKDRDPTGINYEDEGTLQLATRTSGKVLPTASPGVSEQNFDVSARAPAATRPSGQTRIQLPRVGEGRVHTRISPQELQDKVIDKW